jgi:uncharacterized membrane protein
MSAQPLIKVPFTKFDFILEGLAISILILIWMYVANEYGNLPETIPTHFNGSGEVDDYGPKATLFILPAVVTFISILFFVLQMVPQHLNHPVRKITAGNAEFTYRNTLTMMRVLKIGISLFFLLTTHEIISIVKGKNHLMGPWFWVWLLVLVFLPIGIFLYRAMKTFGNRG